MHFMLRRADRFYSTEHSARIGSMKAANAISSEHGPKQISWSM
jgi:hypothetical protein